MNRREFICGLVGATGVAELLRGAHAQEPVPIVGFLNNRNAGQSRNFIAAFNEGMRETGYVEGRNVAAEYRWSEGRPDRLRAMASDLVSRPVAIIAAGGGPASSLAARAATAAIPIVFIGGSDPVRNGLVGSLNRPGGNVTGILNVASALTAKRLALLLELAPGAATIATLRNPEYADAEVQVDELQKAAGQVGVNILFITVRQEREFEPALSKLSQQPVQALFVANDPFFASQRHLLTELVARHALPAIYPQREYADAGGLISYGANFQDLYRQGGVYTGRILKGEKPADMPVLTPSKYELVINLKTAKSIGLTIPPSLLARADEVIE